ncbi:MAG: 4-(cytidine 5'-diphospho)-2-C-methyl-D-erythritol kinase [Acetatifactor sp.]|nr:4-(cytidine 5'-diphospho)-2-C-methyl-D-erythritol kinase [Acetatifactor sp.]
MNTCTIKAYAKINLGLDVLGILPNGYHQVKMIMQTVGIWDELTLEKAAEGIVIATDSRELPTDENNIIYKAARLMQEEFGLPGGIRVSLQKNIPVAAGMAGGSADAAAVMKAMNMLYELELSEERLRELGVRIGADVPYCIMGGTALAEGIGEKLTRLPAAPQCVLVVAKPDLNVSTKDVYTALDAMADYLHPDIDGMTAAIKAGDLTGVTARLGNVLELVTAKQCPPVTEIRRMMDSHGAMGSLMSGSGPTVFGIFGDRAEAEKLAGLLRETDAFCVKQCFVTEFVQ